MFSKVKILYYISVIMGLNPLGVFNVKKLSNKKLVGLRYLYPTYLAFITYMVCVVCVIWFRRHQNAITIAVNLMQVI